MIERLLIEHVWLALLLWAALYASDYYVTIHTARLYRARAAEHLHFAGSFELTPYFQGDVNRLRRFSPRFVLTLLLSLAGLLAVWWLAVRLLGLPEFFWLLLGGLALREGAVHIRHLRNLALFGLARQPGALRGRLEYARWLVLQQSAAELAGFALLFTGMAVVLGSWLALGGALACVVTAYQHWRLGRQARRAAALPLG